uniref:Uncharacterized protein n=1 Tax=Anguilla anguilla TaxID=7936 RepID=A0A0E9SZM2_ANGAN
MRVLYIIDKSSADNSLYLSLSITATAVGNCNVL